MFPCILQYENSYSISIKCGSNPPSYKVDKMIDKCQIICRNLRCIIKFKEDTYNRGRRVEARFLFSFCSSFTASTYLKIDRNIQAINGFLAIRQYIGSWSLIFATSKITNRTSEKTVSIKSFLIMLCSDILGLIIKYSFKYTKIITYIKKYFLAPIEKNVFLVVIFLTLDNAASYFISINTKEWSLCYFIF